MMEAMPSHSDATRWNAVVHRDTAAADRFVYAVRTTNVFCRPTCPSRRPLRRNVRFFATAAAARSAGFRPCRRCHPELASADPWVEKVARACAALAGARTIPTLASLASRAGCSPFHFQRNFKRVTGVTPHAYAEAQRLQRVKRGLRRGTTVTDAMLSSGYESSSRFYDGAAKRLGMPAATYQRGGLGATINYAVASFDLGYLLVAGTAAGVCAVIMGDSLKDLERQLRAEYPSATLVSADAPLRDRVRRILDDVSGKRPARDLPLDVQATAFQWQVWTALRGIPRGETRTYAQVADAIGRPGAARAVARACATNPVALTVPCHRVVPASGGAGGYRWGTVRKRALLAREGTMPGRD